MSKNQPAWNGQIKGSSLGNRIFMVLVRFGGLIPAYALLGPVCLKYAIFDRASSAAVDEFRHRLGLKAGLYHRFRHFYSFGMCLVDKYSFLRLKRHPFACTCIREEIIRETLREGRGAILLSAHIGNWEIAGNLLADRLDVPVNAVLLDGERDKIRKAYREAFEQRRMRTIDSRGDGIGSMIEIISTLRANEILCFHGDRVLQQERTGEFPFLGSMAIFPMGPFAIAAAAGAPIIPVFMVKTGLRHYTFAAHDPIRIDVSDRNNRQRNIREAMEKYVAVLENVARTYPYQWYNFFPFWET